MYLSARQTPVFAGAFRDSVVWNFVRAMIARLSRRKCCAVLILVNFRCWEARVKLVRSLAKRPIDRMRTILVTGGAGFLGSHLCDRLIARGDNVLCLDNFFTGTRVNVEHLLQRRDFELIRHDIVRPIYLEVDQVYNLACPASPEAYQSNPIKTIKTSTVGMVNVLGLAKRCKARILHASTSEVYGDPKEHPQTEEYWGNVNPIGPRSCYDEGKRVAESLCINYHLAHRLEVRIVRIFNTYGPRMARDDGRVISNFIVQALQGKPLTIYGDGRQTRSFCFVDDSARRLDPHDGPRTRRWGRSIWAIPSRIRCSNWRKRSSS